jgi:hypothetical protein
MTWYAHDWNANACVTPECYRYVARLNSQHVHTIAACSSWVNLLSIFHMKLILHTKLIRSRSCAQLTNNVVSTQGTMRRRVGCMRAWKDFELLWFWSSIIKIIGLLFFPHHASVSLIFHLSSISPLSLTLITFTLKVQNLYRRLARCHTTPVTGSPFYHFYTILPGLTQVSFYVIESASSPLVGFG